MENGRGIEWAGVEAEARGAEIAAGFRAALAGSEERRRPAADWTAGELLAWWIEGHVDTRLSEGTAKRYREVARHYIVPAIGEMPLSAVSAEVLQILIDQIVASGLSAASARLAASVLHRALAFAHSEGATPCNAAEAIVRPRAKPRRPSLILGPDLAKLIAACRDEWFGPLIVTAATTGLRRSELLGLRRTDLLSVDRGEGRSPLRVFDLRYQIQTSGPAPRWVPLKTDSSIRQVPIPDGAYAMIARHIEAMDAKRARAGTRANWNRHGLIFPAPTGRVGSGRVVLTALRRALDRAGLPATVRLHDLRHSYLVAQVEGGATLEVAGKLLGHARIHTTYSTYWHLTDQALSDAADRMNMPPGA